MNVDDVSGVDVLSHSNSSACSLQSSYASECTPVFTLISVYNVVVLETFDPIISK